MDVTLQEAMVNNAGEKETRLDGTQCLKRKETKKIKNVEKHIKEKGSNNYESKLPMVVLVKTLVNNGIIYITIDVTHMCCVTIGRWS
jgi:5-enolpyruvylshikimate-3-phosphate synthase